MSWIGHTEPVLPPSPSVVPTIQLQFVRERGIASDAIAWFSQGHFSHVDAVMADGSLLGARSDKVGGQPPGVQIRSPDYAVFDFRVVFSITCTPEQQAAFWTFLNAQVGKPYDAAAILAFLMDRDWRETDSWICSEVQAAALEASGIVKPLYVTANKITPVALALVVSTIGADYADKTARTLMANAAAFTAAAK